MTILQNNSENRAKIKKIVLPIITLLAVIAAGITIFIIKNRDTEKSANIVTKEIEAKKGNLTVGITESGTIEMGSLSQTFSLEWSNESTSGTSGNSTSSSQSSSQSGQSNGQGSQSGAQSGQGIGASQGEQAVNQSSSGNVTAVLTSTSVSSSAQTASSETLVVKSVFVSQGQVVKKNDKILELTSESIDKVKEIYQDNISSAQLALDEATLERDTTKLNAESAYKADKALGQTALSKYNATIASLNAAVTNAKASLTKANTRIVEIPSEINNLNTELAAAKKEESTSSTSNNQMGQSSGNSQNTGSSSGTSSTQIEQQIESLEKELSDYQDKLTELKAAVNEAQRNLTTNSISAKQEYDESMLSYENADKTYELAISGIDDDVNSAKKELTQAKSEYSDFLSFVGKGIIYAKHSGTIIEVGYKAGDSLSTATNIATYADASAVTMQVSVSQDDISQIQLGAQANIVLSAYPDDTYKGKVTNISSEATGTSTVSYPVTVTLTGDVAKVYAGMTGDVTFVAKEISDVVYVSNKAITVEGTKSFVKIKQSDGSAKQIEVVTGFSDGHNVEIKSGVSVGDTLLIESSTQ